MNYNIIENYINFLKRSYLDFFKILFKNKYKKEITIKFIDRYIDVRYYNETSHANIKDFMERLNKELVDLVKDLAKDEDLDYIKNVVACFGYLVYFDDIYLTSEEGEVMDSIINDGIVVLPTTKRLKADLRSWYSKFNKGKSVFNSTINTREFNLIERKIYRKLYELVLEHNVRISNLYSEYAIDKAYNTGTVNEDKLFINYILASNLVLNNAINLDFSRHYLLNLSSSLYSKEKKIMRLFNSINNPLAKKFLTIKITYSDYKSNQKLINRLVNEGYSFAVELDSKYSGNITELFLFPYILVYEDCQEYDMLMNDKDKLKAKIIKL